MSDFEVIQELRKKVSALEEENKLLKEYISETEGHTFSEIKRNKRIKEQDKYKNIDWSY